MNKEILNDEDLFDQMAREICQLTASIDYPPFDRTGREWVWGYDTEVYENFSEYKHDLLEILRKYEVL